jgi:hypothetical protein
MYISYWWEGKPSKYEDFVCGLNGESLYIQVKKVQ